jgi:hypothetical protein
MCGVETSRARARRDAAHACNKSDEMCETSPPSCFTTYETAVSRDDMNDVRRNLSARVICRMKSVIIGPAWSSFRRSVMRRSARDVEACGPCVAPHHAG